MTSVVVLASMLCLAAAAAALFLRARRRAASVGYLDNVSVSRQWLVQHQGDDHS